MGIKEGMPSNLTSNACFDSSGLIWTSTYDGLIGYDGSRMHQYLAETHPGLAMNVIDFLYCDSRNRIWICSAEGMSMLDEHRRMQRIIISDTLKNKNINECLEVPGLGMIAFASNYTYLLPEGKKQWELFTWFDKTVKKGRSMSRKTAVNPVTSIFIRDGRVMAVDLLHKKMVFDIAVEKAASCCKLNEKEIIVASGADLTISHYRYPEGTLIKKITGLKDRDGNLLHTATMDCEKAANGIIYISTRAAGLIAYDPQNGNLQQYQHEPLNDNSISSDNLRRVFCHSSGPMLITSNTGLNITNVLVPSLRQQIKFADETGHIIDNITACGTDASGQIWVTNQQRLMKWDPLTGKSKNIPLPPEAGNTEPVISAAGSIIRDHAGNMWVSFFSLGLGHFTPEGKLIRFLTKEKNHLPSDRIRIIRVLPGNRLIAGTDEGLFMIDPATGAIDSLTKDPVLKSIGKKRVVDIFVDSNKVWIAASPNGGAYCYDLTTHTLRVIREKDGLSSDRVYCIGKDRSGNIYIGTFDGLNILHPDGTITVMNKRNGLRHSRVDNILADDTGRMWITNFHTLICYDPATGGFTYFDEQNGVSNAGFTVGQRELTPDGKLIFCNDGLLIADTKSAINQRPFVPQVTINRMYDDGAYDLLNPASKVILPYNNAKLTLYYVPNSLIAANRFLYRYKMDGLDSGWQQPVKNNAVTYNLRPGTYVFSMQTSYNEGAWINSAQQITITVLPPWWQTWWFRVLAVVLTAGILFYLYRRRVRSIRAREQVKQQLAELEGKALRAQMNPHFIFNSLNAIQELIITEHTDEGYRYLSSFSKLLRMVLNNSEKNLIPLSAELEMMRLYLSLEALRFRQSFTFDIKMDEHIEAEFIEIPPLLLQPYAENAVWHGLRHKEGDKYINIRIHEKNELLLIDIEDNGIGREKAAAIKKQKIAGEQFESRGMKLSMQRIALLQQEPGASAGISVTDKKDPDGFATGTIVHIQLPINLTIN
ncbi:MAG: histidine kinase [Bacteroidetes bacterium]|nr:histidine kinase [Bacteroidota bacterium]